MYGMKEAPVPLAESLEGVIKEVSTARYSRLYTKERLTAHSFTFQIDEAVRHEDIKFASYDHIQIAW